MTEPTGNYQQPSPNQPPAYPNYNAPQQYGAPQGQYTNQESYATFAQAYGQGLPAHMEEPVAPKPLKTATMMMYIIIALGLLGSVLQIFYYEEIQRGTANGLLSLLSGGTSAGEQATLESEITLQANPPATSIVFVIGLIFSLIWSALLVMFTVFMAKGRNWARIVLTIIAAIQILSLLGVVSFFLYFHWTLLLDPIVGALSIVFLVFAWKRPVSHYMQQVRSYRQWKLQSAYMGTATGGGQNPQGYRG
ncbi:hypothetical protein [Rothia nasisuis]|uniref:hypothetical protein n=1 Tax=Rothia nasisuis TaxID=2109647 RepID=UPI001F2DB041|nr:hypothetical protein [Rothia nasisuis]